MNAPWRSYPSLKAGDQIRVTFGSKGSQLAVVFGRNRNGIVQAVKYSAKSNKWTKPVKVYAGEILGRVK